MTLDPEQGLEKRIAECEKAEKDAQAKLDEIQAEILRYRRALAAVRGETFIEPVKGKRFATFKGRPIEAFKILLGEKAGEMVKEKLTALAIKEGVFDRSMSKGDRAKRSAESRAEQVYELNEDLGVLRMKNEIRDGEKVTVVYLVKKPK